MILKDILSCSFFLPKGPSLWYESYPIAQGSRQSPIDIISTQAIYDPSLKPLNISYESDSSLGISNNGHSVMVDFKDVDDKTGEQSLLIFKTFTNTHTHTYFLHKT